MVENELRNILSKRSEKAKAKVIILYLHYIDVLLASNLYNNKFQAEAVFKKYVLQKMKEKAKDNIGLWLKALRSGINQKEIFIQRFI